MLTLGKLCVWKCKRISATQRSFFGSSGFSVFRLLPGTPGWLDTRIADIAENEPFVLLDIHDNTPDLTPAAQGVVVSYKMLLPSGDVGWLRIDTARYMVTLATE